MSVAPHPILTGTPDQATNLKRLVWPSRFALLLSGIGLLFAIATIALLVTIGAHPTHHGNELYSFAPYIVVPAVFCLCFAIGGLAFGVGTRRTRSGRAATVMALILVVAMIACLRKAATL